MRDEIGRVFNGPRDALQLVADVSLHQDLQAVLGLPGQKRPEYRRTRLSFGPLRPPQKTGVWWHPNEPRRITK